MSTLYLSKAKSIRWLSFLGSVSSLNDTVSKSYEVIFPKILGEFSSDKLNCSVVVILWVGSSLGMKSETAAQSMTIDFFSKCFLISKIPFRYM